MTNLYLKDTINELKNTLTGGNVTLEKFIFPGYINISIGKINVKFDGNGPILNISDDINKEYIAIWKASSAKILMKDLKKSWLDNYYYICINDKFYLLRKIDIDFYTNFPTFNNDFDISFMNNKYMIISISNNEMFSYSIDTEDFDIQIEDNEEEDIIEIQHIPLFEVDDLAGGY